MFYFLYFNTPKHYLFFMEEKMNEKNKKFVIQTKKELLKMIEEMSFENQLALLQYLKKDKETDRRKHPRKKCFLEVNYATPKVCDSNFMRDISEGGMFVKTDQKVKVGDEIILTFSFPGKTYIIKAVGEVVRVEKEGIGVEFHDEMMKDITKITEFVSTL